jgi:hypothetical protein
VTRGRADLLALGSVAAAIAVVWERGFLAPARTFTFASLDLFLYYLPMAEAVYGALAHGRLPLWNPYQLCGMPLLATYQVGTFYPFHVPYLVLPVPAAMAASAVLHLLLGAGFTYALARALRLGPGPAAVAALVFGPSGYLLQASFAPSQQEAAIWLPAGLLALVRLAGARATRSAPVAGSPSGVRRRRCRWNWR